MVDSEQAAFESVKTSITDLLAEAQKFKTLQVGFDAGEALKQSATLHASLQEEFNKNPLVLPVILQQPDTGLEQLGKLLDTLAPEPLWVGITQITVIP